MTVCLFGSEEEKDILCKVNVPKSPDRVDAQEYQLAVFNLDYFNVIDCVPQFITAAASVTLTPEGPEVCGGVDEEIGVQRNRCETAQALTSATELADRGDYDGARVVIHRCLTRIQALPSANHDLSKHLIETLQDAEGGLKDKTTYVRYGKQATTSYGLAHWQQRSNVSPAYAMKAASAVSSRPDSRSAPAACASACLPLGTEPVNYYRKGKKAKMVKKFTEGTSNLKYVPAPLPPIEQQMKKQLPKTDSHSNQPSQHQGPQDQSLQNQTSQTNPTHEQHPNEKSSQDKPQNEPTQG